MNGFSPVGWEPVAWNYSSITVSYNYKGNTARASRYLGSRSDASLYLGTQALFPA